MDSKIILNASSNAQNGANHNIAKFNRNIRYFQLVFTTKVGIKKQKNKKALTSEKNIPNDASRVYIGERTS